MTRFLKRVKTKFPWSCFGCAMDVSGIGQRCLVHEKNINIVIGCYHDEVVFILVPRPPDGTRCRDLDGNIKVVGRDV